MWLIAVHEDEPITADGVIEYINFLKESGLTSVEFHFVKRSRSSQTDYEDIISAFDQVCPIVYRLTSRKAIITTIPPPPCKTFSDILKSKFYSIWKEAAFEHFDKNASVLAFSTPFPIDTLPKSTKVLRSLLVPQLKQDEFHKEIWNFKIRHCVDGGPTIAALSDTYSHTCSLLAFRITIALTAELLL